MGKIYNKDAILTVFHAFNNEAIIGTKILKARKHADNIILVDNFSTDKTAEVAQLAGAKVIYPQARNGTEAALRAGIEFARLNGAKIIVTLDTEDEPDLIPHIIEPIWREGYDIVVGLKDQTDNPFFRSYQKSKPHIKESLVFSKESLKNLDLSNHNGSVVRNVITEAEKNSLKIRYFEYDTLDHNRFRNYAIGVVIPAYNEEVLIQDTINGIPDYVTKIYVVDDCSTDTTSEILKSQTDPRIVSVRHEKNKGVGAAIITGYKLALNDNIDLIAVMAGDNQMDPGHLPELLVPIIEGRADYTKGNRLITKQFRFGMSKWRYLGNAMLTMITKIGSGCWHINDPQNGYTVISREALKMIDLDAVYPYYGYCNDLLIKLNTFNIRVEDVAIPARYGREKSKIKYGDYIVKVALMNLEGFLWRLKMKYMVFDFHPLIFFYVASLVLVPAGILFAAWLFIQAWLGTSVPQSFPLIAVFTLLMGIQFLLFAMLFDMQANKSRSGYI